MSKIEGLTVNEIQAAYKIAAKIVAMYGDAYLPVFKRLHSEIEKINQAKSIKSIALEIASCNLLKGNELGN